MASLERFESNSKANAPIQPRLFFLAKGGRLARTISAQCRIELIQEHLQTAVLRASDLKDGF